MRRASKVDTSHGAIRDHLVSIGWGVFSIAPIGRDIPDLVVSRLGYTALVECKSGTPDAAEQKLTEGQREFRNEWQGAVVVAATPEQAESELAARLLGFRLDAIRTDEEGLD